MKLEYMEYMVVVATSVEDLEGEVNELLGKGWKLHGGVSSMNYGATGFEYCQAMIKEVDEGIERC